MEVATPAPVAAPKKAKLPKKQEFDSREIPTPQPSAILMPGFNQPLVHPDTAIEAVEEPVDKQWYEDLAFAEEPVTIYIEPSREKFAPRYQEATCQGKGMEIWRDNRWIETRGVPVGEPVTTKRKYVEILAMTMIISIRTEIVHPTNPDEDVQNRVIPSASRTVTFSILEDRSPRAKDWITSLLRRKT